MNDNFSYSIHESYMERALELAKEGIGSVSPNPLVGCVLVIDGEIIGEGESQQRAVVGETPNLAARLQGIAPANGLVVSNLTKELIPFC